MFTYNNNSNNLFTTQINPADLGKLTFEDMGIVPFYGLFYKDNPLYLDDQTLCKEFKGNCYKWALKYLKFKWTVSDV